MAAIVHDADDKHGLSNITVTAKGATADIECLKLGAIYFCQGNGDPNGEITAPMGSIFVNTNDGTIKYNNDASTSWAAI